MNSGDRRSWQREHKVIEDAMAGRQPVINKRDPVALVLGFVNLLAIIGGWAWYGGRLEQRVSSLEETRRDERQSKVEKVNLDAVQTVQITELQKDVRYMRETLDRIDKKIPERVR